MESFIELKPPGAWVQKTLSSAQTLKPSFKKLSLLATLAQEYPGPAESRDRLVNEALDLTLTLGNTDKKERACDEMTRLYGSIGDYPKAIEFIDSMKTKTPSLDWELTIKNVSEAYTHGGHLEEALLLARRITEPDFRAETLIKIALKMSREGQKTESSRLLNEANPWARKVKDEESSNFSAQHGLSISGPHEESLQTLALAFAETGDYRAFFTLYDLTKGTYKESTLKKALWLPSVDVPHDEFMKRIACIESYESRAEMYEEYAQWLNEKARIPEAKTCVACLQELASQAGPSRDSVLYSLSASFIWIHEPDEAIRLSGTIEEEATRDMTIGHIASTLAEAGDSTRTRSAINAIPHLRARGFYLIELGKALLQKGSTEEGSKVLQEALQVEETREKGHGSDPLFDQAAEIYAKAGFPEEARRVAGKIGSLSHRAYTLYRIAEYFQTRGNKEEADSFFSDVIRTIECSDEKGDPIITKLSLSLAYLGRLDKAIEKCRSIKTLSFRMQAWTSLCLICEEMQLHRQARVCIESMKNEKTWQEYLPALTLGLAKQDRTEMALELCERIEERAEKLKTLVYIASTLEKAGRKKEATAILARVYHEAPALKDGEGKEALLTSLACAYARLGSRKEIDDILKRKEAHEAERDLQQEWLLVNLVEACARRGNVDEAQKIADSRIQSDSGKVRAWAAIAAALHRAGREDEAGTLLSRALEKARSIENNDSLVYYSLIPACEAMEENKYTLKALELLNHSQYRDLALVVLTEKLASKGYFKQAMDMAGKMSEATFFNPRKDRAYSAIAREFAQQGDFENSLALIPLMTLQESRAWALAEIGYLHARSGKALTPGMKKTLRKIKEYRERE